MRKRTLSLFILAIGIGCRGGVDIDRYVPPPPPPPPSPYPIPTPKTSDPNTHPTPQVSPGAEDYSVMRVFYATDRAPIAGPPMNAAFGLKRAPEMTYGSTYVSIPNKHEPGELEAPSLWKFEFREDPRLHVVLLSTTVVSKDAFFSNLAEKVRSDPGKSAFLFVHGYNVSFADAARRTAQITYDLKFSGAPVFYSWPSQGGLAKYTIDEQNAEWTQANIQAFLSDFFRTSEAENVYLIAHSMGNRPLTRALTALMKERPAWRTRLKEVILAAPDIDREVFLRDIAPPLTAIGRPVTLYASSEDVALEASRVVHGEPRAGDSGMGIALYPGIETVDATGLDSGFIGHSYFADSGSVLADLFVLIHEGTRAGQRSGLVYQYVGASVYWKLAKAKPTHLP